MSQNKSMKASIQSLDGVFRPSKDNEYDIVVPSLQRDYRWEAKNINEMFDDLDEHFMNFSGAAHIEDDYFFGSIVFVENEEQQKYYLIDGQQRLTTFSLLLRKIYEILENLDCDDEEIEFVEGYKKDIANMILDKDEKSRIKYAADQNSKQYVLDNILSLNSGEETLSELRKQKNEYFSNYLNRYRNISNKLNDLFEGASVDRVCLFVRQILNHIKFVRIISENEDSVYQLFETLNARGESLAQTELLKNYLLSRLGNEQTYFENTWKEISSTINSIQNTKNKPIYSFDVILRNYFYILNGEKITLSKVYTKYRDYLKNMTDKQIIEFLDQLKVSINVIADDIYNRNTRSRSLFDFCLNQLQMTQMLPILFLISFSDNKEVCDQCIQALSKFISILWISESPYNRLEKLNVKLFKEAVDTKDAKTIDSRINQTTLYINEEIKKEDKKSLELKIEGRAFEKNQHSDLREFLIAIFNKFNSETNFTEPTLEHINPQNAIDDFRNRGFQTKAEYNEYVMRIGNAVVLGKKGNSEAQDKWDKKKAIYKSSGQPKNIVMLSERLEERTESDKRLNEHFYVDLPTMNDDTVEFLTKGEIESRSHKFAESITEILTSIQEIK